ncbi:MAG: NAD-dependent epimerase/dehydratase family protein, partial [Promethearchaeota archaeon]
MSHKALVTGALGHTGTFLVNLLVKKGWKVVAMDLDPNRRKNIMKKETVFSNKFKYMSIDLPGVTFIPADLTDKESLRKLFTPENRDYDVIFHPASLYDYFAELDILMKINVDGLKNLLEVIEEAYKEKAEQEGGEVKLPRFIHWSTCGVYGEPKYKKDEKGFPIPADEDTDYDPPNNYSISKREQELALKEFAKRTNLPYTIIRPAPIYGPHQTYGAFHIFYTVNKVGHMVLPIIFPKRKKLMMPMIHIEDLVEAAFFLWDKEEAIGETYNIVGDSTTEEDFMEFLYQELG